MTDSPQTLPGPADDPHVFDGWMTREALANELGLTVNTLSKWATKGIGPAFIRVGFKTWYRRESVSDWLIEQEQRKKGARK